MRPRQVFAVAAGAVALWAAVPMAATGAAPARPGSAAAAVTAAGHARQAIEVPGLGALNTGGDARVLSVSCPSAGNCAAGGYYRHPGGNSWGFVVSQRHGVWGRAIVVPGLGALNTVRYAGSEVLSVSCASAGNCAAGGFYSNPGAQGFVVSQRHGVWGRAIAVPGLAALNTGRAAEVRSVSCASAGNCTAGGSYQVPPRELTRGFVVSQRNGVWGQAIKVPGLGALNTQQNAAVVSVSCASAGNCAAGGYYAASNRGHGFLVSQRNGVWRRASGVPGLDALNEGEFGFAAVNSVSCSSPGNCVAGGYYTDYANRSYHRQGFVVRQRNGMWRRAFGVPGLGALNEGGSAAVVSVSCAPAGNCVAGGQYTSFLGRGRGFVVSLRDGVWGQASRVPGLRALNAGGNAGANTAVVSVSCASPGNCAAGGYYQSRHGQQGFLVRLRNGVWRRAFEVPGPGILNAGEAAGVDSVSCGSDASCAAAGHYTDRHGHVQGFVF